MSPHPGRRSPIDKMRELADDGLEPWQIAAALGVREDAVLVALAADEPPGGAQRAVEVASLAAEMAETFTAIDEAVDAITPEHIEARLGEVLANSPEETWGVDATQAPMSAPGDATTVDPQKPDTLAPTRPMTRALAEHVAGYAGEGPGPAPAALLTTHNDAGDHTGALVDIEPVEAASDPEQIHKPGQYPCANGLRCRCMPAHRAVCPGLIQANEPPAHEMPSDVTPAEHEDVEPDPDPAEGPAADEDFDDVLADVVDHAIETGEPLPIWLCEQGQHEACNGYACPCCASGQCPAYPTPMPEPEHVHDPFPVVDEAGVWHAECECGTRWDRSPCEYSGCTAYVAALHIARTGTSRHAHHPPA